MTFGFTVTVNANVNQLMFNAVADEHYKLTKYYSLEVWGIYCEFSENN